MAATHCNRGHPFDEENTYVRPNGERNCKECRRVHAREDARARRSKQVTERKPSAGLSIPVHTKVNEDTSRGINDLLEEGETRSAFARKGIDGEVERRRRLRAQDSG